MGEKVKRIHELVKQLNEYRDAYYNRAESLVVDSEYDRLFDELKALETDTGVVLMNSPTSTVGYDVKSKLEKVSHDIPLLSLDMNSLKNTILDVNFVFSDATQSMSQIEFSVLQNWNQLHIVLQ